MLDRRDRLLKRGLNCQKDKRQRGLIGNRHVLTTPQEPRRNRWTIRRAVMLCACIILDLISPAKYRDGIGGVIMIY